MAAIFIPGTRKSNGKFRISRKEVVDDLEKGEWFVDSDVNSAAISARLELSNGDEITSRDSKLRGLVFVAKDTRVLSISEMIVTASASIGIVWPTTMQSEAAAPSTDPARPKMDHVIKLRSDDTAKAGARQHRPWARLTRLFPTMTSSRLVIH